MKKVLSIILAVAVLFSLSSLFAFAEEPAAEDPTTVEVLTYEGDPSPGNWLNQFNEDEECFGNTYVSFRTGAPLKAIRFPSLYAGKSDDDRDVDGRLPAGDEALARRLLCELARLEAVVLAVEVELVCNLSHFLFLLSPPAALQAGRL